MNISDFLTKMSIIQKAYSKKCESVLIKYNISRTAFDIIMFLANNKEYYTANAISEIKNIKPNVVSIHVEKLVSDGYLQRQAVEGDRRKVKLVCTKMTYPIIEDGRRVQKEYFDALLDGFNDKDMKQFKNYLRLISDNADKLL